MLLWHKALQFAGWRLFTIIFKYPTFKISHLQSPERSLWNTIESKPWWETKDEWVVADKELALSL